MPKLKRPNEWHFKNGAAGEIRTHAYSLRKLEGFHYLQRPTVGIMIIIVPISTSTLFHWPKITISNHGIKKKKTRHHRPPAPWQKMALEKDDR